VVLMMRGPPGLPVTMKIFPSRVRTVGVMLDRGRLPGAIALAPRSSTRPYTLGSPGAFEKSSISLLRTIPVPGTVMPEPKGVLMVMVRATALPAASQVERWVVPESSARSPGAWTSRARPPGPAGSIRRRSSSA
jgi:hypothetical protein